MQRGLACGNKSLGATGGRSAFDPPDAVHGLKGVTGEPMLGRLRLEML